MPADPAPDPPRVAVGATDLRVAPIALGTWSWGDRRYWGYDPGFTPDPDLPRPVEGRFGPHDIVDAFDEAVAAGVDLFDTAEVYGDGASERILGWLAKKRDRRISIATKFGLLPGRDARTLPRALEASLRRLEVERVDLYQIHWPDRDRASIDALMASLSQVVAAGKVRAVGVSNFRAGELREAHAALARRGVALASNQVRYGLLHRAPEVDGVLDACRELGVTLFGYSPLGQGILTGKYGPGRRPPGPRAGHPEFADDNLAAAGRLVGLLGEIGAAHAGALPEQVALAWVVAKGAIPIVGAKTGEQARANAGALRLHLADDEALALDRASASWRRPA
jgi:aryl-alcohol dehydrogenase-like predicted oxidoreductase